ncbi:hypothetical protein Tco_0319609 [Tanacetum coccineum]
MLNLQAPEVSAPIVEVVLLKLPDSIGSPSLTTVEQDAPSAKDDHDLDVAHMNNDPFFGIPIHEHDSEASSSSDVIPTVVHTTTPYSEHVNKRTKDHPLENIIGELQRPNPKGIFINQKKYALKSLKKYGTESSDPVDTPMVEKSKLDEDPQGKAVDPTHYRGMVDPHRFEGTNKDGNRDFCYSDTVRPSRSNKVLKLNNFEKDASLQLSSYQIKKGMSMSVPQSQVSQDGKDYKMAKRDYAWLMIL